ncbi:uncharacterized protein LOC108919916 isoform X2 [Scleropages formosus]|uniref:uncharacterized protein LOC108919916 isoform X2 n=1 Tax=Scleropages formosus TaxID=113540 RepID=UPI000878D3CA|nr:uncharacterized protein LOC108919916 isoform X2 [Scleropages formosus]
MEVWCITAHLMLLTAPGTEFVDAICEGADAHLHLEHQEAFIGSSPSFNCTFTLPNGAERFRVNWLLNQSTDKHCQGFELSSQTPTDQTGASRKDQHVYQVTEKTLSLLTVKDVGYNYSGWYYCRVTVEIPELCHFCSRGAQLIIKGNDTFATFHTAAPNISQTVPTWSGRWLLFIAVPSGIILLAVFTVGIWVIYRRKSHSSENPIYENMHPAINKAASPHREEKRTSSLAMLDHTGIAEQSRPPGGKWSPKPYI